MFGLFKAGQSNKVVGQIISAAISVAFTFFVGMPYLGALASSAYSTAINGGSVADFGIGLGVGLASGFAGGYGAGYIGGALELNRAGFTQAALRGGLSGAIGGAGGAAIYKQNIGRGALIGAGSGIATAGVMWKMNDIRTTNFIDNHLNLDSSLNAQQKAAILQNIREVGQSPVGGRALSRFISSNSKLNIFAEAIRPDGNALPGVATGTNDMYFDGGNKSTAGYVANEPWGPSMTGDVLFAHEIGHAKSAWNYNDPLNVAHTENLYRAWNGLPARNNYAILNHPTIVQPSNPVPSRGLGKSLIYSY